MKSRATIVARIMGGLGNQLFCYAAARRHSLAVGAELLIDNTTGFLRDRTYKRKYALGIFNIPCKLANRFDRLEPLERYRRVAWKVFSRLRRFENRGYITEESQEFDRRLISLPSISRRYLDGLWQDERYFYDVESHIRKDLSFTGKVLDSLDADYLKQVRNEVSVAVHVRWFDPSWKTVGGRNLAIEYYREAFLRIDKVVPNPRFFLFSDDIPAAKAFLEKIGRTNLHTSPTSVDTATAEFCAMSHCTHFITANSTYSWWAAWLARPKGGTILLPDSGLTMRGGTVWRQAGDWSEVGSV